MVRSPKAFFGGAGLIIVVALFGLFLLGRARQPQGPPQPIAFSHRLHAGEHQIPCLYCHATAARSLVAGVPPVQTCFECHRLIEKKSPEVQKALHYWDAGQPIPWIRIHSLPDFVYFSHKRHVRAGLSCQTCHGEVQREERLSQVAPLTMGWCVDCHRERGAPLECSTCHK